MCYNVKIFSIFTSRSLTIPTATLNIWYSYACVSYTFIVGNKIKVKFRNDHEETLEVDLMSKEIKTVLQIKDEIAKQECVSNHDLIFTIFVEESGSAVLLEDDDLLEKWNLDKGGTVSCSKGTTNFKRTKLLL